MVNCSSISSSQILTLACTDAAEEMDTETALVSHDGMAQAMDLQLQEKDLKDSKSLQLKKMISPLLLDCIRIDREYGMNVVDSMNTKWLAVMEQPNTDEITTLDQYFAYRYGNIGLE